MKPLLSVIIPHVAGTEILQQCLASLPQATDELPFETLLVDNGSTDGSVAAAVEHHPQVRVVRFEENQGYAGGCNRGIEQARGRYVLLLNDDAVLEPECLGEMVRTLDADPSVAACQPKIRALPDTACFEYSGAAGGLMDVYGYPFSRGRLMGHVERDEGQYDDPAEIFWASGVCMLVRRSVLETIGAFDETFFAYMEEIDLSWRIHLGGHRIVYVPTAVVYHRGGYSLERTNVKRMYLNHRNSMMMVLKNYSARSLLTVLPVKILLELFIFTSCLLRNPRRSQAVLLSFGWLLTHLPTLRERRAEAQALRTVPDAAVSPLLYRGMAPVWYFVFGIHDASDLPDVDEILHRSYRPPGGPALRTGTLQPRKRNFLFAYLDQAPVSLALMRAVECNHLSDLPFERPILDVGCGDGTFARILFNGVNLDAGIDADGGEVERARAGGCYDELQVGRVESMPFTSERFATVMSNCALEHVPDIDGALREIARVLRPGGSLYITVPNPRCVTFLLWRELFQRVGLTRLGDWYGSFTLRMFKSEHILEAEGWAELFRKAGLELTHHEPYMSRAATRIQDVLLPTAFVSVMAKKLLGRKLVLPRLHRAAVRLYRRFLVPAAEERPAVGSATLLVARKPVGAPGS